MRRVIVPDAILVLLEVFVAGFLIAAIFFAYSEHNALLATWLIVATVMVAAFVVGAIVSNGIIQQQRDAEEKAKTPVYGGSLVPGNAPVASPPPMPPLPGRTLPSSEPAPTDEFAEIVLGNNRMFSKSLAFNPITFQCKPLLAVRVKDGQIFVTTTIVDSTNQYIVRIIDNEFQASNERAFNPLQADPHSLFVRDGTGATVLDVRYENRLKMTIKGRFHIDGFPPIILSDDGAQIGGISISDSTVVGMGSLFGFGQSC